MLRWMNIWKVVLKLLGWKVSITVPYRTKCVICVAPHTSNWDFLLGLLAYRSAGRKANFLMKDFWFFFPLKYLLKCLGGIPVYRNKDNRNSLTEQIISLFNSQSALNIAITPEGTRSITEKWKTGFLYIARGAMVPIQLGVIDYANKIVFIHDEILVIDDINKELNNIKQYYSRFPFAAKHPSKFRV